MSEYNVTDFLV